MTGTWKAVAIAALVIAVAAFGLVWTSAGEFGVTNFSSLALRTRDNRTALDVRQDHATADLMTLKDGATTEVQVTQALFNILDSNLKVGNGTPGVTQNGEDVYIEGTLEVDGTSQFDGAVTLPAGDVSAGEIANVTVGLPLSLLSWIDCETDGGALIDFTSGADNEPDYVNSATDGTGFVLRFDDTGGSEDEDGEVCTSIIVPQDYASGGALEFRTLKDADAGATETISCGASVNGAALGAAGTVNVTPATSTRLTCTPAGTFAAGDSISFWFGITSATTMDDAVDIAAVLFQYVATQ